MSAILNRLVFSAVHFPLPGQSWAVPQVQREALAHLCTRFGTGALRASQPPRVTWTKVFMVLVPVKRNAAEMVIAGEWAENWLLDFDGTSRAFNVRFRAEGGLTRFWVNEVEA